MVWDKARIGQVGHVGLCLVLPEVLRNQNAEFSRDITPGQVGTQNAFQAQTGGHASGGNIHVIHAESRSACSGFIEAIHGRSA